MSQNTNQPVTPAAGELVRVHHPKASAVIKQRLYKVIRYVETYEMFELEWVDAPKGSKERYFWAMKDFVRKA